MNSPLPFPLDRLTQVEYRPLTPERLAADRERQDFAATNARGDADTAVFERSQALRARAKRREKRAAECRATAVVCLACFAALMLPSLVGRWPWETLMVACGIGAVAGIVRGAKTANPWW